MSKPTNPSIRNWTLDSYENDTWTTIVRAPAIIDALIIANTAAIDVLVSVRISRGENDGRAIILPDTAIEAGKAEVLDLCELNLGRADVLQLKFSAAGVNVTASGEEG